MNRIRFFLKTIKKKKALFLFILFVFICWLINLAVVIQPTRLTGESVSTVLMATAPLRDRGVPYQDYWGEQAPGILLLIGLWVNIFGFGIMALKILQLLFLLGNGMLIYFVLKKVFSAFYALLVGAMAVIVLFSPYLNFGFLPSELFGLFFSLLGLVVLLNLESFELRFFLATLLFGISGQMKDSFFFSVLAILPFFPIYLVSGKSRLFRRALTFSFLGFIAANLLIGAYLWRLGAMASYWEILKFKLSMFDVAPWQNFAEFKEKFLYTLWHSRNIIAIYQSEIVILFQIWLVALFSFLISGFTWKGIKKKSRKDIYHFVTPEIRLTFNNPKTNLNVLVIVFYSLGSFLGFYFQGVFDFRTLVQLIPPTFFFWALIMRSTLNNILSLLRLTKLQFLLLPLLILFLFPKGSYLTGYLSLENYSPRYFAKQVINHLVMVNPNTEFEDYLATKTIPDLCILSVYGWSVGETYFYTQRPPCSRFFLPSDITMTWQKEEYKRNLFENPPQAIVYSLDGANVDVLLFEPEVIDFSRILDNCYRQDFDYHGNTPWPLELYFPNFSGEELKTCLEDSTG